MTMQIDAMRIRNERNQRAWSQEHLASVSNLGIRTVQRIESSGNASIESIKALASVFEISVEELIVKYPITSTLFVEKLYAQRFWVILAIVFVTTLLTPPQLTAQLVVFVVFLFGFELLLISLRRRNRSLND